MAYMTYYRSQLDLEEQKIYDILVEAISKREDDVVVTKIDRDRLFRIYTAIDYDYPDFFYVDFYEFKCIIYPTKVKIDIKYIMDIYTAARIKREIDKKAYKIADKARLLKNDLEKEAFLNDEIKKMAEYGRIPGKEFNAQHLIGTFLDGICVCEGFAKSFKYLADMIQLKCILVVGDSGVRGENERHAWNMVQIDGESYFIDVTYNEIYRDSNNNPIYCSRAYFNLSDREIRRDHLPDTDFNLPVCNKSLSQIAIVSTTKDLINAIKNGYKRNDKFTEIRVTKMFEINEIIDLIRNNISPTDIKWFNQIAMYHLSDYTLAIEWR